MFHSFVNSFLKEEDGQDLVEYSLLLAFIGLGAVVVLGTVKTSIQSLFTAVNTKLTSTTAVVSAGQ